MSLSVKLEAFDGPLDLLLHLIEKNKIDIFFATGRITEEQYNELMDIVVEEEPKV